MSGSVDAYSETASELYTLREYCEDGSGSPQTRQNAQSSCSMEAGVARHLSEDPVVIFKLPRFMGFSYGLLFTPWFIGIWL